MPGTFSLSTVTLTIPHGKKASSSRRGEAGLQLKIRIFSTYFLLVFRKHNEMLQEVIRNYKIIVYLNK